MFITSKKMFENLVKMFPCPKNVHELVIFFYKFKQMFMISKQCSRFQKIFTVLEIVHEFEWCLRNKNKEKIM